MLEFQGGSALRPVIVCSLLSRRPVRIRGIHTGDDPCGLKPHEANFLKFIQRVTTGSTMQAADHNTTLTFQPGLIAGGNFEHEVPAERGITYIMEAALLLLPFAKQATSKIRFIGSTQSDTDISADTIRVVTCRLLQLFGIEASMRIVRRGCGPTGGGVVELTVNSTRQLRSVRLTEVGKIRRIRGIAFAGKTAPDLPQRAAVSAKGVLLNVLPDVYVVPDVDSGSRATGYGIVLVAETTTKVAILSQETVAGPREAAEDVGARAAALLLEQVAEGGCVDAHHQLMVLLLMGLGPAEASSIRLGPLTPSGVTALTLLEQFFGVKCAVKTGTNESGLPAPTIVTCIGANIINIVKKSG